ncbi:MAG: pyrroline-5-carboxylate reductase [Gammaproteobacteria bacterium]
MTQPVIAFIGGGNMASALLNGLVADGYPTGALIVTDPDDSKRQTMESSLGIRTTGDNDFAVGEAQVVVLAVKPQVLRGVCESIRDAVQRRKPLIISIAAGVRSSDIERWLGDDLAVVRCMPNTPAMVGAGATGLLANQRVSAEQRQQAEMLLRAAGVTVWVKKESDIDVVTAISGSGPAYYFRVMEAMQAAAEGMGMPAETARLLTLQTAFGAAKMALESDDSPATLREKVTSPGGTTEQAINALDAGELGELFDTAMRAARDRAEELADMLGKD